MAFTLVADAIKAAFRVQGIIASGDAPSDTEYQDALEALNVMLSGWSAKRYLQPVLVQDNALAIPAGANSRTIGPSGDLVTERPMKILTAYLRDSSNLDYPFGRIGGLVDFDKIHNKLIVGRPCEMYYLPTHPNGIIYFDYIADANYTLYLQSQKVITNFPLISTPWTMPEEYDRAIKYNLAIELASEFGVPLRPDVVAIAKEALRDIKRLRASDQTEIVALPSGLSMETSGDYMGTLY